MWVRHIQTSISYQSTFYQIDFDDEEGQLWGFDIPKNGISLVNVHSTKPRWLLRFDVDVIEL